MQDFGSSREKYNFHNYMTVLVKALEGEHTVVDLRNESSASGLIKHVDGFMNIEMQQVTCFDPRGNTHYFEDFYISARNIRYVHIPEKHSSTDYMQLQLSVLKKPRRSDDSKKKHIFKIKRAERYNAEIIRSNYGPSTSKEC